MMVCQGIIKNGLSNSVVYACGICGFVVGVRSVLCGWWITMWDLRFEGGGLGQCCVVGGLQCGICGLRVGV